MCTKFEVSSFSRSRNVLGGVKISNGSRDLTNPFERQFVVRRLGLIMTNLPTTKIRKVTQNVETEVVLGG